MRNINDPARLIALMLVMSVALVAVRVGLVSVAFHHLGISAGWAMALLLFCGIGSLFNVPVARIRCRPLMPPSLLPTAVADHRRMPRWEREGHTVIAINVGGAVIPIVFSAYLMSVSALPLHQTILAASGVSAIAFLSSQPVAGVGIAMPMLIAPVAAALLAFIINPDQSAPLAYIGGTFGVLVGADLLRLRDIRAMQVPLAAIGGAGTFDGIFLTGLVAVLIA